MRHKNFLVARHLSKHGDRSGWCEDALYIREIFVCVVARPIDYIGCVAI